MKTYSETTRADGIKITTYTKGEWAEVWIHIEHPFSYLIAPSTAVLIAGICEREFDHAIAAWDDPIAPIKAARYDFGSPFEWNVTYDLVMIRGVLKSRLNDVTSDLSAIIANNAGRVDTTHVRTGELTAAIHEALAPLISKRTESEEARHDARNAVRYARMKASQTGRAS